MGAIKSRGRQLASVNAVVAHAGLSAVPAESVGTSPDERIAACDQHGAGVSVAVPDDRPSRQQISHPVVFVAPA